MITNYYSDLILCETQTSGCWVDSLDSSVQQRAASLLNPADDCYSGPALSESLMIVELKQQFYSTDQWDYR